MSTTHEHDHDHGPDGAHAHHPDHHLPMTYHEKLTTAVLELLIEKQLISADAVRREIEAIEGRTPQIGAAVVAKAWSDPEFKARLLADGNALLGLPPSWYKSKAYRSRIVREPRAVLAEFGLRISDDVTVRVLDSTANTRYFVIPQRPSGTAGWTPEQLTALVSRDAMVGTAVARTPAEVAR